MRLSTKERKKARREFEQILSQQIMVDRMYQIISQGKQGLDSFLMEIGRMMAETIMYIDREEVSGLDSHPMDGLDVEDVKKAFNIPDQYWVPLLLAIGHFDKSKTLLPAKWRKGYNEIVVSF